MQINSINANLATSNRVEKQVFSKDQVIENKAKELESFFVFQMLQQTQPEVDLDSDFSGGTVEQTFRPILNQYLADEIVEAGGVGLKEDFVNQMKKYEKVESYGR